MMDPTETVAWCARCRRPAPVDPEELIGDEGGDPSLIVVLVPPDGWIGDPEDPEGGLICGDCATPEEIVEWMGDLVTIEHKLTRDDNDA